MFLIILGLVLIVVENLEVVIILGKGKSNKIVQIKIAFVLSDKSLRGAAVNFVSTH